jgi:prefoldin subunit 5
VELSEQQVIDLFRELGEINARLDALAEPGAVCAVHTSKIESFGDRLNSLETQQGKQNLIAVTLGAIGAGLILALKYLLGGNN